MLGVLSDRKISCRIVFSNESMLDLGILISAAFRMFNKQ